MDPVLLSVSHVRQRNSGECVAACSMMALTYLGFSVPYKRLVELLKISWFGTPSFNIRELEKLGVAVIYKQGSFAEIQSHLENGRPSIAFVKTRELPYWEEDTGHAVLVVGLDDEYVYVNDPAMEDAPIQISRGDFDLAWLEWDELYAVFMRRE